MLLVSTCYYSDTGVYDDYDSFENTGSYQHSTDIYLDQGSYTYHIQCLDLGGNIATGEVSFEVETDTRPPTIIRLYNDAQQLKIATNEEAECVYDTISCNYNFEDGIAMTSADDIEHYTEWNTRSALYIKCQDEYDNRPRPNDCSIIVRPIDIS